jgi:hypothetical protein
MHVSSTLPITGEAVMVSRLQSPKRPGHDQPRAGETKSTRRRPTRGRSIPM